MNAWADTITPCADQGGARKLRLKGVQGTLRMASTLLCFLLFRQWLSAPWQLAEFVLHAAKEAHRQGVKAFMRWPGIADEVQEDLEKITTALMLASVLEALRDVLYCFHRSATTRFAALATRS